MRSNGEGFLKKSLMAFAIFLMLPTFAVATQAQQGWGWGQNDDRRRERRERRRERREDRRERREARRDNRDDDYYRRDNRDDDYYRNDGYNRNDGYYGNNNARQTALNAGYNNGIEEGRKDRQRGERFEYRDESDYQKATEDYNSRLGDRNLYQQYFRQGFANGYRTGYNGY